MALRRGRANVCVDTESSAALKKAYYIALGALTLLLTSAPYLYGWYHTPPGTVYSGFAYNIDDSCVYLSWMRQAANGHFFLHNQFSTDAQKGVLFNLLFWVLGTFAGVTHIAPILVYHGSRILGGACFLWAVYCLLRETIVNERARLLGYAFVCLSAGLGYLWRGYDPDRSYGQPVDLWQPEAISFLSIYFSPLFAFALALIVIFLTAAVRTERTGKLRDSVPAMIAGALLGNFHSYDVIHVFAVWFVYRIVRDVGERRFNLAAWLRFGVVGACALPTTAYVYWALKVEPVFYKRAFVSPTLSPALRWDLAGFGIPLGLAVAGIARQLARKKTDQPPGDGFQFLVTWAIVGIAVAYIPVAFQRKMLMGAHVPICALAGYGLWSLTAELSGSYPTIAAIFAVLLSAPSNALFLLRDCDRLSANVGSTSQTPYLKTTEIEALDYLRDHTRPEDAVMVSPNAASQNQFPFKALEPYLSVYIPALAGNVVYDGHWSETADFGRKLSAARNFFRADAADDYRRYVLQSNGIKFVLVDNRLWDGTPLTSKGEPIEITDGVPYVPVDWSKTTPPDYLKTAYQNADITIYSVALP